MIGVVSAVALMIAVPAYASLNVCFLVVDDWSDWVARPGRRQARTPVREQSCGEFRRDTERDFRECGAG